MPGFSTPALHFARLRLVSAAVRRRLAMVAFGFFSQRLERGRQRRALAQLDDRLLRDIGLNRYEAEREIGRSAWRG